MKNSEMRRRALRRALNAGLALGFLTGSIAFTSPALAQLRTGRSSDREFYEPSDTIKPSQNSSNAKARPSKSSNTGVVQASANEELARTPNRQVKQHSTSVRHASGSSESSHVEQAGCKNCQAGTNHSHIPVSTTIRQSAMDAEQTVYEEPSTLSEVVQTPDAMVFGSSRDPYMEGVGTAFMIQTPPVVGNFFRRLQFRVEAATFWPEGQNLPQLVTTRRPASNPATDGLIGNNDTINLFGGNEALGGATQGLRGELGSFFDSSNSHGFLLRFFDMGSDSLSYVSTPTSEPVVMRPFFSSDPGVNAQSTVAINYPNSLNNLDGTTGSLNANITSEAYGGDILFRKSLIRDSVGRLELLGGYQTARISDSLRIDSTTTRNLDGVTSQLRDQFMTTNRFNGMTLGLNGIMRERYWTLSGMVKLGFGNMDRTVDISGSSTITVPGILGSTSTTQEGLLARNTNAGSYATSTFIVAPETNLTLGYRLTRRLEATVGYSYLGLPKVARVADQLDPRLAANLSNPPSGPRTPSFTLRESNYGLHSLDYGLQWRY